MEAPQFLASCGNGEIRINKRQVLQVPGEDTDIGELDNLEVSAQDAWHKLSSSICADSGLVLEPPDHSPVYMLGHPWLAEYAIRVFRPGPECSCEPPVGRPVIEPVAVEVTPPAQATRSDFSRTARNEPVELDTTTVTGNRELPKVLYIVPWKKSAAADPPAQPFNKLMDEALAPLDRDEFRRELSYYEAGRSPELIENEAERE